MNKFFKFVVLVVFCMVNGVSGTDFRSNYSHDNALYFCTAVDSQFYNQLLQQIGAIHRYDFDSLVEIAIFDLGLTSTEKKELETMEKVKVYALDMTNSDLLTLYNVRASMSAEKDRKARGWYAWKPVVIKQALDMFPYVLYMDSGISPSRSLKPIFEHIKRAGCFLITCGHSIRWMTTSYVLHKFNLTAPENVYLLHEKTNGISAGLQGVSRVLYNSYIKPMYELSKDMRNFVDDGTTPEGFGTCRHDQPLFSIFVHQLKLPILKSGDYLNTKERTLFGEFFHFKGSKIITQQFIRYKKLSFIAK